MRLCGGFSLLIGRGTGPDLMAAVRCHAHMERPYASRRRPSKADAGPPDAGAENANELGEESDTFRGFAHGEARVYGERGGLLPTLPAGVKMHIAGAHETLKRRTGRGGDALPYITGWERYAKKSKQSKAGDGDKGVVAEHVSQIPGEATRTVNRAPLGFAGR